MENKRIGVIGAGIGGLSAAIHLAAAGRPVTVLEQNADVGGKMGLWQADGFTWDTGPSIITMRPALEALFATAGRRLEDYLTLLPVDPLTRYFYPVRRPHNRCPDVRGLYFAGGTTHPGGGVPMVTLSGGVAARLLLRETAQ